MKLKNNTMARWYKRLFFLFVLMPVGIFGITTSSIALQKKQHDNEVVFNLIGSSYLSYHPTNVQFVIHDISYIAISQGQPNDITVNNDPSEYGKYSKSDTILHFGFGRHKTFQVADTFNQWIADQHGLCTGNSTNSTQPKALNMAIRGDLRFKLNENQIVCKDFILAQGSNRDGNNWWLGCVHEAKNTTPDKKTISCLCQVKNTHSSGFTYYNFSSSTMQTHSFSLQESWAVLNRDLKTNHNRG